MLPCVGTGGELSGHCRLREHGGVGHERLDGLDHGVHGSHDAVPLLPVEVDCDRHVPLGYPGRHLAHLLGIGSQLPLHQAGDEVPEGHGEEHPGGDHGHHYGDGPLCQRAVAFGGELRLGELRFDQGVDRRLLFHCRLGAVADHEGMRLLGPVRPGKLHHLVQERGVGGTRPLELGEEFAPVFGQDGLLELGGVLVDHLAQLDDAVAVALALRGVRCGNHVTDIDADPLEGGGDILQLGNGDGYLLVQLRVSFVYRLQLRDADKADDGGYECDRYETRHQFCAKLQVVKPLHDSPLCPFDPAFDRCMARQAMSVDLADLSARTPQTVGEIVYSVSICHTTE